MSALEFLSKPSRKDSLLGVVHVNHGTLHADNAQEFVEVYCKEHNINLKVFKVKGRPPQGESKENWWRIQRYEFFNGLTEGTDDYIILAHNMDDCLEEMIMSSMIRGFFGTIPYQRRNCVRPFRMWKREDIESYAAKHSIRWIEDPSNTDQRFKRNFIRHSMVSIIKQFNPGIYSVVRKAIKAQDLMPQ